MVSGFNRSMVYSAQISRCEARTHPLYYCAVSVTHFILLRCLIISTRTPPNSQPSFSLHSNTMKFYGVLVISIMVASSALAAKVTRERDSSGKPEIDKVRERKLGSGLSGKLTAAPTLNPTTSPTLVGPETIYFIPVY